jgi:proline iminopeptidase
MVIEYSRFLHVIFICLSFIGHSLSKEAKAAKPLNLGEHTVVLNGMKLWYKVSGIGPVCLMPSPAWGISSDLYFRTLGSMEKIFTIVYIDSRGTGRSGRAKTLAEYTWEHLIGDLDALRNHFKQDKVWLMGHSGGGEYTLHYASKYPKRVAGMVLLNTLAVHDRKWQADIAKRIAERKGEPWYEDAVKALQSNPKTEEEIRRMLEIAQPLYWSDPNKAEMVKDHFDATSISAEAWAGANACKRASFDLRSELKKVTAPVLIVVGDDDFICSPESATIMHLALPNSKLLLIENCGHAPWMEQSQVFETRVSEFLRALGVSIE